MGHKRKTPTHFNCKYCGKEKKWTYSSTNTYCNNRCQQDWSWEHIKKPQIRSGEGAMTNGTLRRFLVEEYGGQCKKCGIGSTWNNAPLTLHVDHIDGNSDDNRIENIRLLCPNCHSQTETWCGRNVALLKNSKRNVYKRNYYKKRK